MNARVSLPAVREILATVGPLTSAEVASFFPGGTHQDASKALSVLRRAKAPGHRVYIKEWTRHALGQKDTPRPVYALGDKRDAKPPKPLPNAEITRRYRQRQRIPRVPTSVFDLARFL